MTYLSSLKLSPIILAFAILALPLYAQDKGGEKRAKKSAAATDKRRAAASARGEEEKADKGLQIGKLLPLNKPNLRVKIPSFDKGELASMVEAEKLTRIDESNLRLEDATIQLVQQSLMIRLRTALYNTDGAILSSNQSTTVSSKEFTMTGATMDFDTSTGKGRMGGPVRMIIHNVDSMSGPKGKPEAKAVPASAAAKPTREETK
jgi:hypothetical protein